ncbi:SURF1 family protein [Candidatus Poriferisodalis sp.]|uniref:SURF1 family protein n=1 Tax=Candidatus Poriferisodalis sp. TaxID=3101277 RepID=UPI003AF545BD
MYHFARTPRWLAGHALAGVLLAIFLIAGFWQLNRHGEQRDRNAAVAERQDMRALDADRFFEAVLDAGLRAELEYRLVSLPIARFDFHEAVQIRNRSLDGLPGCHFAVPAAATSNDSAEPLGVLVVAGWLPQRACTALLDGEIAVYATRLPLASQIDGRIRLSQERGLLGPSDPAQGQLDSLARTDVGRIDQQTTLDLVPVYVEVVSAASADGSSIPLGESLPGLSVPVPVPPPELAAGPHLGYALQWFSFAAVAIVGYSLVLRHQARRGESEQIADD